MMRFFCNRLSITEEKEKIIIFQVPQSSFNSLIGSCNYSVLLRFLIKPAAHTLAGTTNKPFN